jgi:hypothetical protein
MELTKITVGVVAVASGIALSITGFNVASGDAGGGTSGTDSHVSQAARAAARAVMHPLPPASHFRHRVTNRYFPLRPGTRWVYRGFGSEGGERDVVFVLSRTKTILGIKATVVRDVVRKHGRVIERTFDWYAQDRRGRVWYLGENTHAFEHGQVDDEGSWEAGVDGAKPGIVMFRHPRIGVTYWQEFYEGHAEDQGTTLDRFTVVTVAAGRFRSVRMTEDTTPLEPATTEFKFYARGVGTVLEIDASPEQGRVELIRMTRP